MRIPDPKEGLVINYSYLWHREAQAGAEEGRKDRPCAVVLAGKNNRVIVAPITHSQPVAGTRSIEIPPQIKKSLGLDHGRSWIVTNDVNYFTWPGTDLRPMKNRESATVAYGTLPPNFTKQITADVRDQMQRRQTKAVNRDEATPPKDWGKKVERSKPRPAPKPDPDKGRSR